MTCYLSFFTCRCVFLGRNETFVWLRDGDNPRRDELLLRVEDPYQWKTLIRIHAFALGKRQVTLRRMRRN